MLRLRSLQTPFMVIQHMGSQAYSETSAASEKDSGKAHALVKPLP